MKKERIVLDFLQKHLEIFSFSSVHLSPLISSFIIFILLNSFYSMLLKTINVVNL